MGLGEFRQRCGIYTLEKQPLAKKILQGSLPCARRSFQGDEKGLCHFELTELLAAQVTVVYSGSPTRVVVFFQRYQIRSPMAETANTSNLALEEYKALRAEMIRHMDSLDRNVISTITATGVAIAYGVKESPFVLLLAIIIPIYFWIQHVNNRRKLAKLSSYLSVFLEGKGGLMWHRRNQIQMRIKVSPLRYYLRSLLLPYPLLIIVSTFVLVWYLRRAYISDWPLWLLISATAIVVVAVVFVAHKSDRLFSDMLAEWESKFKEIAEQESHRG